MRRLDDESAAEYGAYLLLLAGVALVCVIGGMVLDSKPETGTEAGQPAAP